MGATLDGLDKYSGSTRAVRIETDGPHVVLAVEATSGGNEGESVLTPAQARSVATWLNTAAHIAEGGGMMEGNLLS